MKRGDTVRPTADACAATKFTDGSRLRVARRLSDETVACRACGWALGPGDLFAKGREWTSLLCLGCVEPVPKRERVA